MKKFCSLLLLIFSIQAKLVYRIIRPRDYLHISFQDEEFKTLVEREINKFDVMLEKFQTELEDCLMDHASKVELAQIICLGEEFSIFHDRYTLTEFKIQSIFENIIYLLISQNCRIYLGAEDKCNQLIQDIRFLVANNYDVLPVIDTNKNNYISQNLTSEQFSKFYDLLEFCFEKYDEFTEKSKSKRDIMRGKLWIYYEENVLHGHGHDDHGMQNGDKTLAEAENQISVKIIRAISEENQEENGKFRNFIELETLPNPFQYEDELLEAALSQQVGEKFEDAKERLKNRNTRIVENQKNKGLVDCSLTTDYNGCVKERIMDLYREDTRKSIGLIL